MRSKRSMAGFSLIELLFVIAITVVIAAIAIMQIGPVLRTARVNTAAAYVLNEIRHTRERAIDERRKYQIKFTSNVVPPFATMQVFQGNTNAAGALIYTPEPNILSLPYDMRFLAPIAPKPAVPPDGICGGTTAIDLTQGAACDLSTTITLNPDGSITDPGPAGLPPGPGGLSSGVIYLGRPGDRQATRAISFFGATGRTKGWSMVQTGAATWVWSSQ